MKILTASGLTDAVYLDGIEFNPNLSGVFFIVRTNSHGGLVCEGVHPDCEDHMVQYDDDQKFNFCRRAEDVAANDDPCLYSFEGEEAWVA